VARRREASVETISFLKNNQVPSQHSIPFLRIIVPMRQQDRAEISVSVIRLLPLVTILPDKKPATSGV
jgi:hypothetical protein